MSVQSARSDQGGVDSSGGVGDSSSPNNISAEQIAKVTKELEVVRSNMTVLSEILVEIKAGGQGNHPEDLQLLRDLYRTCKEMQGRVSQLLCTPLTDELTIHMLQINDDLNDLFDRYDRKVGRVEGGRPSEMSLIDLADEGATPSLISDIRAMNLNKDATATANVRSTQQDDKAFDNLAQSRGGNLPSKPTNPTGGAQQGLTEDDILEGHRETDFEEMEAWLKANPGAAGDASLMMSMPNPQFDAYLAARSKSDASKANKDLPS